MLADIAHLSSRNRLLFSISSKKHSARHCASTARRQLKSGRKDVLCLRGIISFSYCFQNVFLNYCHTINIETRKLIMHIFLVFTISIFLHQIKFFFFEWVLKHFSTTTLSSFSYRSNNSIFSSHNAFRWSWTQSHRSRQSYYWYLENLKTYFTLSDDIETDN